jgi:hypothetical protein
MERLRAYAISAILLAAMIEPAFRSDPDRDSYPFSTYPMFTHRRGRTNSVSAAIAVHADGSEARVPPSYVANAETMQAFYTLARAVNHGGAEARALCESIAEHLRAETSGALAHAVRVELITESVDAIDYLGGRQKPFDRRVHARCSVEGKQ